MENTSPYQSKESHRAPYERLDVQLENVSEKKVDLAIERFQQLLDSKEVVEAREESSDAVDQAVKVRIERSRQEGESIMELKKLAEMHLEPGEETIISPEALQKKFGKLKSALESRLWRGIFENLNDGDTVMTVTEPKDKIFSLKIFNDYILGQQKTDSVIGARRRILQKHLGDIGIDLIDANFKFSSFRMPSEMDVSPEQVTDALDAASEEISLMIIRLIEDDLASQETVSPAKKEKLDYLMKQLAKDGYPVRYGISKVNGAEMIDKTVAVSEAMVAARSFERNGAEFGQEYEDGLEARLLDTFYKHSNTLVNYYNNEIKDADGFTYQIFEKIPFMELALGEYEVEVPMEMTSEIEEALKSSVKYYDFEYDAEDGEVLTSDKREEVCDEEGNLEGYRKVGTKLLVKQKFTHHFSEEYSEDFNTILPYMPYDEAKGDEILGEVYEKDVNGVSVKMAKVKRKAMYQMYGDRNYRRVINKDLVRAVRKGKFQPYVGDNPEYRDYTEATAALEVIKEYIDVLNTIDLVRPYTEAELTDNMRGEKTMQQTFDEIDQHISTIDDLLEGRVMGEGFEKRIGEAADYLEGAMKNKEFTTRGVFHEEVSQMDKSAVLAIDIGDLGVDVLRTYEEDLFAVDAKMINMQDVYAGIGDRETYAMNSIRNRLVKLYDEIFDRGEGEKIIGLVEGGDEIIFAFDLSLEGESEKIDEFRRRLQSEVGVPMRVVLTSHEVKKKGAMQGISVKELEDSGAQTGMIDPRLEAHILSMDRSERGADASKTCEASLRKLYKMIEHIPSSSSISEGQIRELVVTQGLNIQEWEVVDTLFLSDRDDFEDVKPLTFKVTHLDKSITEMTPDELQGKIEGMYVQVKELEQMMDAVANFGSDLQVLRMQSVERRRQYSTPEEDAYEKKVFAALNGIDKQKWVATLDGIKDGKFVVSIGQGDEDAWNRKDTDTTISLSSVSPKEITEHLQTLMDDIYDKINKS